MTSDNEEFVSNKDIPVIYVDAFRIGYDAYKFVGYRLYLIEPKTSALSARLILSHENASVFSKTLSRLINEYEETLKSTIKES